MGTPKTGFDCKLYRNTGTYASPTWTLIKEVADLRMPTLEWGAAEIKTRSSKFKAYLKTMFDVGVEFDYLYKADNTNFDYLRAAVLDPDQVIDFWIADGLAATPGTEGLRFHAQVFSMSGNQELESVNMQTFQLKPTYAVDDSDVRIEPTWYEIEEE